MVSLHALGYKTSPLTNVGRAPVTGWGWAIPDRLEPVLSRVNHAFPAGITEFTCAGPLCGPQGSRPVEPPTPALQTDAWLLILTELHLHRAEGG